MKLSPRIVARITQKWLLETTISSKIDFAQAGPLVQRGSEQDGADEKTNRLRCGRKGGLVARMPQAAINIYCEADFDATIEIVELG